MFEGWSKRFVGGKQILNVLGRGLIDVIRFQRKLEEGEISDKCKIQFRRGSFFFQKLERGGKWIKNEGLFWDGEGDVEGAFFREFFFFGDAQEGWRGRFELGIYMVNRRVIS